MSGCCQGEVIHETSARWEIDPSFRLWLEGLREDWFANCVKPPLNKDITYLLTYFLTSRLSSGSIDQQVHSHNEQYHGNCTSCNNPFLQLLPSGQLVSNSKLELNSIQVTGDDFLYMTVYMVVLEGFVDQLVWNEFVCVG